MEAVGKTCLRHQELNQDWTDKFGIHEPTTVFGVMGKVNMSKGVNVARKEDQGASPEHSTSRESVGSWEMDGVVKCCW